MGASEIYDEILVELGDFRRFQIQQYLLLIPPVIFTAAFSLTFVFTAATVPHRCLVPECGDLYDNTTFMPPWLDQAIPRDKNGDFSSCYTFTPLNSSAPHVPDTCRFDNSSKQKCDEWIYEGPEQTILTEFTLTCPENAWLLALVGTINSAGTLFGLPLSSYISDKYGRTIALILTLLGSSVLGIGRAFTTSYESFVIVEFLEAIFTAGTYTIAFVLAMELVGPKGRVLGGGIIVLAYGVGNAFLGLAAMLLRQWRNLLLVLYAPTLLIILYFWLLQESVRWLMTQGKLTRAKKLILQAADQNKVTLSPELLAQLETWKDGDILGSSSSEDEEMNTWAALKKVAKSRILLLRMANCSFCWVTNTLVYFGLSLNSVSLAGTDDIYLNFILVSLVEATSYVFTYFGTTYFGRRRTLCTALLVSGFACIANPFIPTDISWLQLTLYLIGKFAITSSFNTMYVFASEMFPTQLRSSLMGACSTVGRIGTMLAPLTPLLTFVSPLLPMTLFGAISLLAGVLALLFPETLGRSLPDSVLEAEQLGEQKNKLVK